MPAAWLGLAAGPGGQARGAVEGAAYPEERVLYTRQEPERRRVEPRTSSPDGSRLSVLAALRATRETCQRMGQRKNAAERLSSFRTFWKQHVRSC